MGSAFGCMPKENLSGGMGSRSNRGSKSRSQRKMAASEDELLHRQALAMAIQQHQLSQRFEGSMSRRIGSTSSRRRDLPDSITNGKQVILVGHSCGGASISYAMECYPKKILKAVFLCATMDIALATLSMRTIPLEPIMETLSLTPENYGMVRRFFIQTLDDRMLSPDVQEKLVRENPPHGIYKIKGSDHCPFFSKPQSLYKILLEIAQLP
ncbi:hypothetical protein B296_00023303 [Ensete ventricosum]|uniref:AB hydrolase-1 domain-containing protein n=1 Tax=Ensete ventricosum TaxID=4639 RepID=A0A426ZU06_ENSVE|nr:hypothetical protein B296_00023303 [Ensete ventricosum]